MPENIESYGLDLHCSLILKEYRELNPVFFKAEEIIRKALEDSIHSNGIYINALETRVKTEKSLAGKLDLKGGKYGGIFDLTDIVGARIITFYSDEVDKISALVDRIFDIDWANSEDKRRQHELNSFGYNSLHYICRIPKRLYSNPDMPQINSLRFEIQMRTAIQHVWATMYHDIGYKSGIEIPKDYIRNLNRLAGMLELADEQFSLIRTNINDYRRQVQQLVASGKFDDIHLNGDSFASYLKLKPFTKLAQRIAAINQAEVHIASSLPFLEVLKDLHFETLGDVERMIREDSDDAYALAVYQIGNTDIDIIASTIAIQDLCLVHIIKNGGGRDALTHMFDLLGGNPDYNRDRAERVLTAAGQLSFSHKK